MSQKRDDAGRFSSPATRRPEPHPARGEVFSDRHRAEGQQRPRGAPGWRADLARDARADDAAADRLNPTDTDTPTPRQPR